MKTREAYKALRKYVVQDRDNQKNEYIQLYYELLEQIDEDRRYLLTAHFKKHYYDID